MLDGELGVSPLEETTALYEAIRENALPVCADRSASRKPSLRGGGRLSPGRPWGERRLLADALVASSANGRVVLVEGEAGIGKTRLVDELAERAAAGGSTVARARV